MSRGIFHFWDIPLSLLFSYYGMMMIGAGVFYVACLPYLYG